MAQHAPAADVLGACRTDLNELTAERAPCKEVRAVVKYLESLGKHGIGIGRAAVTIAQLDLRTWPPREPIAAARRAPPWG
jgi:hypothetical protein